MEDLIRAASTIAALLTLCLAVSASATDLLSSKGSPPEWATPVSGPTCEIKDGVARIAVPQRDKGFDHWIGPVADAPILTSPAPPGDWVLTARIDLEDYAKDSSFHIGLVVGFSKQFVCTFGPLQDARPDTRMTPPQLRVQATGLAAAGPADVDCSSIYLRILKRGNSYECSYRPPNLDKWTQAGDYLGVFEPKFVGVIGKTFDNGPGIKFSAQSLTIVESGSTAATEAAAISIDAARITGHIDRNIYGHFIEHMQRCIWDGLYSEMLWNRKFTGGSDDRGLIESWSAFGDGATYAPDNRDFYTSSQSQRIDLASGKEAGIIKQNAKMGIKPGRYIARAIVKQKGLSGGVTLALRQGTRVYASETVPKLTGDWARYEVVLNVTERDSDAQFSVSATGPGTLWIGCLSLMPADNVGGVRRDVLQAVKAIKPPNIRWPGGNMVSGYHWMDGIGEPDRRMPRWERAWGNWEWNDFGTDDFIAFCREVGTEPYICVNAGEGNADEAARWVEYCNGDKTSEYGKLRARNGHSEPYRVRYWGIGNEMYGDWQLGHLGAAQYALKSIEFAKAMRAVDPSIKLIGVGVPGESWGNWNTTVARIAGSYYDYISVHHYSGLSIFDSPEYNYLNVIGSNRTIESFLADTSRVVDSAAGKHLPIAFDEWNVWVPGEKYEVRDGLFAAGVLNTMQRLGDSVTMANLAQLVNVLGAIHTTTTDIVETPVYKAFELYSNLCFDNRCETKCQSPGFDTPAGRIELLDAAATISDDGKKLVLTVINRDPLRDLPAKLTVKGFKGNGEAEIAVLNGPSAYSANSFASPNVVGITRSRAKLDLSQPYTFPAHSVTVITLPRS